MSVEGIGRFQPVNTSTTSSINNNSKLNVEKNQNTQNVEKVPSLDLNSKLNLSKISNKEFKNEIQFVVPANNQSIGVKLLGGVASGLDIARGSFEILARDILNKLKSE